MVLEAEDLSLHVRVQGRPLRLLDGLSLRIEPADAVGVLGPSGSGKSTLLRLLSGLEPRSRGVVRFGGKEVGARDWPTVRARCALLLQEIAPLEMSALAWMEEVLRFGSHRDADPGRVRDRLAQRSEDLGLTASRLAEPLSGLSGGERRRAHLACLLACEPDFLLLDEPTTGLDRAAIRRLVAVLAAERARGVGMLIASHDEFFLARSCARVLVLFDGLAQGFGPTEEVLPGPWEKARREGEGSR